MPAAGKKGIAFIAFCAFCAGRKTGAMNVSDIGGLLLRQVAGKMDKYGEYAG